MTLSVLLEYTLDRGRRLARELGAQDVLDRLNAVEKSTSPFIDEQAQAVSEVVAIIEDLLQRQSLPR